MLRLELAVKSNQGELETDLSGNMCKNTKKMFQLSDPYTVLAIY